MQENDWPDLIRNLPEADIPFDGVRGWLLQSADHQLVFFDIEPIGEVPRHHHGAQWGTMISGEMDLTIGDETRRIVPGDSYYIPAGVEHGATFHTRCLVIDLFEDVDRYKSK